VSEKEKEEMREALRRNGLTPEVAFFLTTLRDDVDAAAKTLKRIVTHIEQSRHE